MHGRPAGAAKPYIEASDATPAWSGIRPASWVSRWLARLTGLDHLIRIRQALPRTSSPAQFAAAALRQLRITPQFTMSELARVPTTGRLLIVANHPFGALDGLIALSLLGSVRPDLRVLANQDLCALQELAPALLPVQLGGSGRTRANTAALRRALRWLREEGALLVFPAGEVSHFDLRSRCVTDPPWGRTVAVLARTARAPVVPMHFAGRNGLGFQLAGLLHPRLRTWMLPGQLRRHRGEHVKVRIGPPLGGERVRGFHSDEALTTHLRLSSYLLAERAHDVGAACRARPSNPVALSGAPADLAAEVARLPEECRLLVAGDHQVLCAESARIPNLLDELGRLRELTFRAAGEGTGRARDLDAFDEYYRHLFIWNERTQEVVGAYRIGAVDEIRRRLGVRGLYTASLFHYRAPFFPLLGPALELGRSFVRAEYQKTFAPLLLLWKGIGEYLARHPRYLRLLGPVSISNDYAELSRHLLVEYLRSHCQDPLLASLVRPVHPLPRTAQMQALSAEVSLLGHVDALAALIEDLEPDRKGVPVLLRQYLRLGGRLVSFNVDPAFNDAIDCLLLLDLRDADRRVLGRYLPPRAMARLPSRRARQAVRPQQVAETSGS